MSYLRRTEYGEIKYKIIPDKPFSIICNCSGCGSKTIYMNTRRFRVNANGSKLDVWLIYQCGRCKHTKNLAIYERQNSAKIPKEEYQRFLSNDEELALELGKDFGFFMKNRVEVAKESVSYHYETENDTENSSYQAGDLLIIKNPYELRIHMEKQAAEVLGLSRSRVRNLLEEGWLAVRKSGSDVEIKIYDGFNVVSPAEISGRKQEKILI